MITMDTYSPKELEKLLSNLKLKGLKVTKIESGSHVFNAIKEEKAYDGEKDYSLFYKDAEIDWDIILTLDNGKKIGFFFASSSHVNITNYAKNYELKDVDYQKNELNVAKMFPEIIGKTISGYKIFSVDSLEELGDDDWEDAGFKDDQDEYITEFRLIFDDGSHIGFKCYIDFMLFYYQSMSRF